MKIGILTFHRAKNYGAVLQCYALMRHIQIMGHEAQIIDYYPQYFKVQDTILPFSKMKGQNVKGKIFEVANFVLGLKSIMKRRWAFNNFVSLFPKSKEINKVSEFNASCYDIIFVGSDQVWNRHISKGIDDMFTGNFAHTGVFLASYAASTILNLGKEEEDNYYKQVLSRFDFVSVREKQINEYFNMLTPHVSLCVCDPVLLLQKSEWEKLAKKPKEKDYILIYTVPEDPRINKLAEMIANECGSKVIELVAKISPFRKGDCRQSVSPQEFIGYFCNAKYIVTTSFHGTAFSVKFEKPFTTLRLGTKLDERALNLLDNIGLMDRSMDIKNLVIPEMTIDYSTINNNVEKYLQTSYNFINTVVESYERK